MSEDKGTFLLIDQPVGKRDDRASRLLVERGYGIEWCCPGEGIPLPEPDGRYIGALAYGGPESVNKLEEYGYLRDEIRWIEAWVAKDRPFLGICLGAQMLARALDAPVAPHPEGLYEIGYIEINPTAGAAGFLPGPLKVYHWHNEGFEIPRDADLLAEGPTFPNQAFRYGAKAFGIQFHPEVTPPVMRRWMSEAGEMLERPGAHSAERQLADAANHDAGMEDWLQRFFDSWLP